MPKYSSHLIFNFVILILFIILYQLAGAPLTTMQLALFLIFYTLGSIILTPDLDSKSEASRRCGIACAPYRKLFKHRGTSHHPIYGVASRILYVALVLFLVLWVLSVFGLRYEVGAGELPAFMRLHVKEIGIAGAGLFIANLLHIALDKLA